MIDAAFCTHANEVPSVCDCSNDCYCKTHTCRVQTKGQETPPALIPDWAWQDDFDRWDRDSAAYKSSMVTHQPLPADNMLVDSRQPNPIVNSNPPVHRLVIRDFEDRGEFGKTKYGTYLQAHNGRDVLKDAYQEALDLCQYLRQLIFERDSK